MKTKGNRNDYLPRRGCLITVEDGRALKAEHEYLNFKDPRIKYGILHSSPLSTPQSDRKNRYGNSCKLMSTKLDGHVFSPSREVQIGS